MVLTFTKTHDMARSKKYCSICYKEYSGWGNNALPVNSGRCCDYCNLNVVVFARWDILIRDGIVTKNDKNEAENGEENSQKADA
jgi:hypothetical protein